MASLSAIRKQIQRLEAEAERITKQEMSGAIAKIKSLMSEFGVTLEHLSSTVSRKASAVKKAIVGKRRGTAKRASKGAAKYQDSKTGATWSGFGRAPGWIAGAKNRDAFLVDKSGVQAPEAIVKAPVAKKKSAAKTASAKKVTKLVAKKAVSVAKKATRKAAAPVAAKKKPSAKKAAPKAVAKKPAKKRAAPTSAAGASTAAEGGAPSAI